VWVRKRVAYLSATTMAQSGGVCFVLPILLFHSLGAVGAVRLFLEKSNVSCLTEILCRGDPIPPLCILLGAGTVHVYVRPPIGL
jgi:hypothetical protein